MNCFFLTEGGFGFPFFSTGATFKLTRIVAEPEGNPTRKYSSILKCTCDLIRLLPHLNNNNSLLRLRFLFHVVGGVRQCVPRDWGLGVLPAVVRGATFWAARSQCSAGDYIQISASEETATEYLCVQCVSSANGGANKQLSWSSITRDYQLINRRLKGK